MSSGASSGPAGSRSSQTQVLAPPELEERLAQARFAVEVVSAADLGPEVVARNGLIAGERLYLAGG